MNKKKILSLVMIGFSLFIPKVYAFSYDFTLRASATHNIAVGGSSEVIVTLDNIKIDNFGISVCIFDIETTGGIKISSNIRSFGSWSVTPGAHYMVDTFEEVKTKSDLISIPITVNSNGTLSVTNITCSTEEDEAVTSNKTLSFSVKSTDNGSLAGNNNGTTDKDDNFSSNEGNDNESVKSSDCDLSDILINDAVFQFDPNILEYSLSVENIKNFTVTPILSSDKANYVIGELDVTDKSKTIKILVTAENGMTKTYTLYIDEKINNSTAIKEKKVNYKIIFIVLIVLLVFINIFRIIRKKKNEINT